MPKINVPCLNCQKIFTKSPSNPKKYCDNKCQGQAMIKATADNFWTKVSISSPDNCWQWNGYVQKGGYGYTTFECRKQVAHRIAYKLTYGPIPEGLYVCHTCDNRLCQNPAHLWLGTHTDNMRDMWDKGRAAAQTKRHVPAIGKRHGVYTHPESLHRGEEHWMHLRPEKILRGEQSPNSKLNWQIVCHIRESISKGLATGVELSKQYGVCKQTISDIVRYKNWKSQV